MAVRVESFTYNGTTVGGATNQATTEILGRFEITRDESAEGCRADFVCDFIVKATTATLLNSTCLTLLAALRTPNAALSVDWTGAGNVESFDPTVATSTGFLQAPSVRKIREHAANGPLSRAFTFHCSVQLPPNYTGANGRRSSTVSLHYDTDQRRVISISGVYTQIPTKTGRAALLADINSYAATRIALVDNSAKWAITRRDEPDDNFQTTCSFARDYSEIVTGGRRGSVVDIAYRGGLRMVTISGTYLRTVSAEGGGTSAAASVNFADGTTGGVAFSVLQLAALTTAEGGALVPGDSCELVGEPTVKKNEQDDRLDYVLVYRELDFPQSRASTPGFDDPEIILDSITFIAVRNPLDDSPIPPPGGTQGGTQIAAGQSGVENSTTLQTVSKPNPSTVSGPANLANQDKGSTGGNTQAQKPIDLFIRYKGTLVKSVTNMLAKYTGDILPFLVQRLPVQLGYPPAVLIQEEHDLDETTNDVTATVHAQALPGDVLAFQIRTTTNRALGLRADGAFNGQSDNYLLQQGLPRGTARRVVSAMFKTGGSFKLEPGCPFETKSAVPGYIVMNRSYPDALDRIMGVPSLGIPTQPITNATLVEDMLYAQALLPGSASPDGSGKTPTGQAGGGTTGSSTTGTPAAQATQAAGVPVATGTGG